VRSSQVATDADDADTQLPNAGSLDVDATQPTLAERLKSLNVVEPFLGPSSGGPTTSKSKLPTLGSGMTLTQTLIQALHSSDSGLLESCLAHTDPKLIRATVKRLPTQLVLPFVDNLVERLGRNKKGAAAGTGGANAQRGREIVAWLRGVLVVHIGYLLTVRLSPPVVYASPYAHHRLRQVPSLVSRLASLHKTVDARLVMHDRLLALNGRLELLVSQIDMRREEAMPRSQSASNTGVTRYVEGESSDEMEMDDAQDDEGSVEDVVLGAASEKEDQDESEEVDEDEDDEEGGPRTADGFMELEAEESGSGGSGDDDLGNQEDDSELDGFIVDDDEDDDEEDDEEDEEISE
jgi:U3 small nucleolar RNA-associated protein 5